MRSAITRKIVKTIGCSTEKLKKYQWKLANTVIDAQYKNNASFYDHFFIVLGSFFRDMNARRGLQVYSRWARILISARSGRVGELCWRHCSVFFGFRSHRPAIPMSHLKSDRRCWITIKSLFPWVTLTPERLGKWQLIPNVIAETKSSSILGTFLSIFCLFFVHKLGICALYTISHSHGFHGVSRSVLCPWESIARCHILNRSVEANNDTYTHEQRRPNQKQGTRSARFGWRIYTRTRSLL